MGGMAYSITYNSTSNLERQLEIVRSHGIAVTELPPMVDGASEAKVFRFKKGIGNVAGSTSPNSNDRILEVGCDRLNPMLWLFDGNLAARIVKIMIADGSCKLMPPYGPGN